MVKSNVVEGAGNTTRPLTPNPVTAGLMRLNMNTTQTCSVANCESVAKVRGWCGRHYSTWHRRGGDPGVRKTQPRSLCTVSPCDRPSRSNGMCTMHLARLKRLGSPTATRVLRPEAGFTPADRFHTKYEKLDDGCWEWRGSLNHAGYGQFNESRKKTRRAHRYSYELLVGPIPAGLELDHLCRNRACVNPAHLQPVVTYVNMIRSLSVTSLNSRKTHCVNGHEFTEANTKRSVQSNGRLRRSCITCRRAQKRSRK